jgi:hypothetical protein
MKKLFKCIAWNTNPLLAGYNTKYPKQISV